MSESEYMKRYLEYCREYHMCIKNFKELVGKLDKLEKEYQKGAK